MAEYSIEAELKANVGKFRKAIQTARDVTKKFKRESESVRDTELDADIKPLKRNIRIARKLMQAFSKERPTVEIDADTSKAQKKIGFLMAVKKAISRRVVIPIEARTANFQKAINRMANFIHSFGVVTQNMIGGIGLMFSSTLVPIIASIVPAIMAAGNAVGVLAGGALALGTSFATAGTGAVMFASVATSALGSVFEAHEDIRKLNEELAKTDDLEERAKILEQIEEAQSGLTDEQLRGLDALQEFSKFWGTFAEQFQKPVMDIFIRSLGQVQELIKALEPAFEGAVKAVDILSESFGKTLKTDDFQKFIDFLNDNVQDAMVTLGKAFGNIIQGLMNIATAFGPLSTDMQNGFLGMTEKFVEWSSKLSESKAFQSFVDFVRTNLPKVQKIFGDVFTGIINLFAAFGDNSSIIFDALSEMTGKFKTWSENIKNSDGFQQFIDYVQENGPKVIDLIGNVVDFIIELGIALAPMGAKMLEVANAMISWTTELMRNNPLIGKLIALATVVGGALIALVPFITMVVTAFSGFGGMIMTIVPKLVSFATTIFTSIGGAIMRVLPFILRIGGALLRFAGGPIGLVIQAIILLGIIIYQNWDAIKAKTIEIWNAVASFFVGVWEWIKETFTIAVEAVKTGVSTAWNWIKSTTSSIWNGIKSFFSSIWNGIKSVFTSVVNAIKSFVSNAWNNIKSVTSSVWNGIKSFFSSVWNAIKSVINSVLNGIRSIVSNVWNSIRSFITSVLNGIKSVITSVWNAIKSVITSVLNGIKSIVTSVWNGIKNTITTVVNNIKSTVSNIFNSLKGIVTGAFTKVTGAVKNGMSNAYKAVTSKVKDFFNAGKNIVGSIADGIKGAASKVTSAISNVTQKIRDFLPFSPAKEGALRDIMKIQIPQSIAESINRGKRTAVSAMANLTSAINGEMPKADVAGQITSSLKGLKRNTTAQVQSGVNADVTVRKQPIHIHVHNEADAEWLRTYVNEGNAINGRVSLMSN